MKYKEYNRMRLSNYGNVSKQFLQKLVWEYVQFAGNSRFFLIMIDHYPLFKYRFLYIYSKEDSELERKGEVLGYRL